MACDRKVVGANLNLKWLSNYHQGALEQSGEAALCSTVDCCECIRQIPGVKVCKCAAGKPHAELSVQKEKTNKKCMCLYRCSCPRGPTFLRAYRTAAAALLLHPPSCTLCCISWYTADQYSDLHSHGRLRSTRLGWCPCGEICLRLQTAFAPAKSFKQGDATRELVSLNVVVFIVTDRVCLSRVRFRLPTHAQGIQRKRYIHFNVNGKSRCWAFGKESVVVVMMYPLSLWLVWL